MCRCRRPDHGNAQRRVAERQRNDRAYRSTAGNQYGPRISLDADGDGLRADLDALDEAAPGELIEGLTNRFLLWAMCGLVSLSWNSVSAVCLITGVDLTSTVPLLSTSATASSIHGMTSSSDTRRSCGTSAAGAS